MNSLSLKAVKSLDSSAGEMVPLNISVERGRFIQATDLDAITLPKGNYFLTPGLTDLHTHLFNGQDLGISPERDLRIAGVVRAVDAGSAGAHLFEAFRNLIIDRSSVEIRAFLNISSIGTTSVLLQGELMTPAYCNVDLAVSTLREHADVLIGIKVRASKDAGGEHVMEGLTKARKAADLAGVPLMAHLGPPPVSVKEILSNLGSGDILTHCYTGWTGNTLVENGKPKPFVAQAIERGVLFDVGHGRGGFDSTVAATMIQSGYLPNSISTDIHSGSIRKVVSLPNVMSKFLALGMSLEDVISRTTSSPKEIGQFVQSLDYPIGELANFALFEIEEGDFEFADVHGHTFHGNQKLRPSLIFQGGEEVLNSLSSN